MKTLSRCFFLTEPHISVQIIKTDYFEVMTKVFISLIFFIVAKFDNNSDLQKFEKFALALLQQLRKTFTFKEGGFPGVTIFNYEGEASLERIKVS